jgi:hypothetical protein
MTSDFGGVKLRSSLLLSVLALVACRAPADPTQVDTSGDGGLPTPAPEVEPDTGKPIGPVAAEAVGGTAFVNSGATATKGGAPGIVAGAAGIAGVGGTRYADQRRPATHL